MATQYDIFRLAMVESTQDEAQSRMDTVGIPVLVIADEQIAGRARQGREWTQPDRGLFASVASTSDWDLTDRTLIPLVAGVAMRRAVKEILDIEVGLKWPNDLMVGAHKIGGILVEMSGDTVVVGCGLNLWWDDPLRGAGTLLSKDPGDSVASKVAEVWASTLLSILEFGSNRWPRGEYIDASVTLGQQVQWDGGSGCASDISDIGALIVDQNGAATTLHSGEVHMCDRG